MPDKRISDRSGRQPVSAPALPLRSEFASGSKGFLHHKRKIRILTGITKCVRLFSRPQISSGFQQVDCNGKLIICQRNTRKRVFVYPPPAELDSTMTVSLQIAVPAKIHAPKLVLYAVPLPVQKTNHSIAHFPTFAAGSIPTPSSRLPMHMQ